MAGYTSSNELARLRSIMAIGMVCTLLSGCSIFNKADQSTAPQDTSPISTVDVNTVMATESPVTESPPPKLEIGPISLINPDGVILKERFLPPDGYSRQENEAGSFAEFLQSLPMKADGSKVKYFDGREKSGNAYLGVVDYSLGDRDLQQCADAVMRLRAEYLYATGGKERISFNFVNGFTANYSKWADGYGISVDGNNVSWVKNSRNDDTYESFQKYLDIVYAYSSTLSLEKELVSKSIDEMAIGDVFIIGGSPGHCVIIVDMATNSITGDRVFMLAQSYMPAQDIQILRGDDMESPWYTADLSNKLVTPEWTFDITQLKTWQE